MFGNEFFEEQLNSACLESIVKEISITRDDKDADSMKEENEYYEGFLRF